MDHNSCVDGALGTSGGLAEMNAASAGGTVTDDDAVTDSGLASDSGSAIERRELEPCARITQSVTLCNTPPESLYLGQPASV